MIPFNKSTRVPSHLDQFQSVFSQSSLSGNGPSGQFCEEWLSAYFGTATMLTTSATHALEMMAFLLDIKSGDEIIMPSFTFVSSPNAFVLRGARIAFADVDLSGNILISEVERLVSKNTKAVLAVDYAGNCTNLEQLSEICERHGLYLLQDSAQSLGALYKKRPMPTWSDLACISFHDTKNVTAGEGGALVIGNRLKQRGLYDAFVTRAEILREKGTNRRAFFQGLVDKYTWVDLGSSYVLSELNAAYLKPQLPYLEEITARRVAICDRYHRELLEVLQQTGVNVLSFNPDVTPNGHIFAMVLPRHIDRAQVIAALKASSVSAVFHYLPLHTSPFGRSVSVRTNDVLPNTEILANQLIRLPVFFNLSEGDQTKVIEAVRSVLFNLR